MLFRSADPYLRLNQISTATGFAGKSQWDDLLSFAATSKTLGPPECHLSKADQAALIQPGGPLG